MGFQASMVISPGACMRVLPRAIRRTLITPDACAGNELCATSFGVLDASSTDSRYEVPARATAEGKSAKL